MAGISSGLFCRYIPLSCRALLGLKLSAALLMSRALIQELSLLLALVLSPIIIWLICLVTSGFIVSVSECVYNKNIKIFVELILL